MAAQAVWSQVSEPFQSRHAVVFVLPPGLAKSTVTGSKLNSSCRALALVLTWITSWVQQTCPFLAIDSFNTSHMGCLVMKYHQQYILPMISSFLNERGADVDVGRPWPVTFQTPQPAKLSNRQMLLSLGPGKPCSAKKKLFQAGWKQAPYQYILHGFWLRSVWCGSPRSWHAQQSLTPRNPKNPAGRTALVLICPPHMKQVVYTLNLNCVQRYDWSNKAITYGSFPLEGDGKTAESGHRHDRAETLWVSFKAGCV